MTGPFSPEARNRRRLARLQKLADAFATSHALPGSASDGPIDRQNVPVEAIRLVSEFLGQFTWPMPPVLTYRGMRTATRDERTSAVDADAQVILSAQIVTMTGCRKEIDIPVHVRAGKLLEPSVVLVDGVPRILAQSLVDEIVRQGTFRQKVDPRGGMFGGPMGPEEYAAYAELDDQYKTQDRYSRGMYTVGSRTAQAARGWCQACGYQGDEPDFGEPPACPNCGAAEIGWGIPASRIDREGQAGPCRGCGQWQGRHSESCEFADLPYDVVRIEYGTVRNKNEARGDWLPMVWVDGQERGDTYASRGYDEDEALARAKQEAEETASKYIGDWQVSVTERQASRIGQGATQMGVCPRCGGDKFDATFPCRDCGFGGARPGRRAQKYDSGARVKVSGDPARVIEQVHEPTGNGVWDGTYRVEFQDGRTDVVPESKLSIDQDRQTLRHVEGQAQRWCEECDGEGEHEPWCSLSTEPPYEPPSEPPSERVDICASCGSEWQPVDCPEHGDKRCSVCNGHNHYMTDRPIRKGQVDQDRQTLRHVEGQGREFPFSVEQTPTGRWQLIYTPDEPKGGGYLHLDCDAYADERSGKCEACGAESPLYGAGAGSSGRKGQAGDPLADLVQQALDQRRWDRAEEMKRGGARGAAREGDGQPAEHNQDRKENDFSAGDSVSFARSFRNRTRGGPSYLIDSGTSATVVKDVAEDGTKFEVRLDDGEKVVVPRETLKRARRADVVEYPGAPGRYRCARCRVESDRDKLIVADVGDGTDLACPRCYGLDLDKIGRQAGARVDQVLREVEALKEQGYDDVDVLLRIHGTYPAIADAVMEAAADKGLLDLEG